MKSLIVIFAVCFGSYFMAFAQDIAPSPVAVAVPSVASTPAPVGAKTLDSANKVVGKIPSSLPIWIASILGLLSEIAMRVWPTVKPKSWFIFVAGLFSIVALGLNKISSLLDQAVQNIDVPTVKLEDPK